MRLRSKLILFSLPALLLIGMLPVAGSSGVAISNAVCRVILNAQPGVYQQGHCTGTFTADNPTYRQTILADNPVAYWRMGDAANSSTIKDENGNNGGFTDNGAGPGLGHAGALVNDPTTSWSNDGTAHDWEVPDSAALDLTQAWTIEAWVNTTNQPGYRTNEIVEHVSQQAPYAEPNGGGGYGVQIAPTTGTVMGYACRESAYTCTYARGHTIVSSNAWHLVHTTFDGTTIAVYLDGQFEGSIAYGQAPILTPTHLNLYIGEQGDPDYFGYSYSQHFQGAMQDVALYGYALSATQVTNHWNARTAVGP